MARSHRQSISRFDDAAVDEMIPAPRKQRRNPTDGVFRCTHCRQLVFPLPQGGKHRNHCPLCLHSRHVDVQTGDRMSDCGASMAPVAAFQRADGEHAIIHRCLGCGFERFNRIAADDDFALVLALPVALPRTSRHMKRAALLDATETTPAAGEELAAE